MVSMLVGGSVLRYLVGVAGFPVAWALVVVLTVLLVIVILGAYKTWSDAYRLALLRA